MAFSKSLEKDTVRKIISIYCHDKHKAEAPGLCSECQPLLEYAERRIDQCVYGDDKPVCAECSVHCYKTEMRVKIKEVMGYAGPKMLARSPVLTVRYLFRKIFKSKNKKIG